MYLFLTISDTKNGTTTIDMDHPSDHNQADSIDDLERERTLNMEDAFAEDPSDNATSRETRMAGSTVAVSTTNSNTVTTVNASSGTCSLKALKAIAQRGITKHY